MQRKKPDIGGIAKAEHPSPSPNRHRARAPRDVGMHYGFFKVTNFVEVLWTHIALHSIKVGSYKAELLF